MTFVLGEFDVLVGINLLREWLDIPEVSLVAFLMPIKKVFKKQKHHLCKLLAERQEMNTEKLLCMPTV